MKQEKVKETKVIPMMVDGVKKELSTDVSLVLSVPENREELIELLSSDFSAEAESLLLSGIESLMKAKAVYKAAKYGIMDEPPEQVPETISLDWAFTPVQGGRFSYRKEAEKAREQALELGAQMAKGEIDATEFASRFAELQQKAAEYDQKADEQKAARKPRGKNK